MAHRQREILIAKDVYSDWKRLVTHAASSVVIFSPYLDRLVTLLLKNAKLPSSALTVVTDLTPQQANGYLGQLRTLTQLLDLGVQVRSLSRLHAKILLVDDQFVISGSQNFTTYARKSKEASAVPTDASSTLRFIQRLQEWLDASEVVDRDLVDRLLKDVKAQAKKASEAEEALHLSITESMEQMYLERQAKADEEQARRAQISLEQFSRDRLFGLPSAKSTRLAQGEALIHRSTAGHWLHFYTTFKARSSSNLTSWLVTESDGTIRRVNLDQFDWYPVLMTGSGRMTRARIVKTRITYVKPAVKFGQTRNVDDTEVRVQVSFPETTKSGANVIITLTETPIAYVGCRIEALFDGESFTLVGTKQTGKHRVFGSGDRFEEACRDLFTNPIERDELFNFICRDIRFSETEISNHNAEDFFQGEYFRLRLLEYAGTPVLLAHKL
jgi:hypothetical protein